MLGSQHCCTSLLLTAQAVAMERVRRILVVSLGLVNSSTCGALLVPGALQSTPIHGRVRAHAYVSQIARWRGGAVEKGDGQRPTMSTQLGLVRVAGYGIIAGSLCLKTPQIARVWRAKSLAGLAPTSIYADVFLFATSVMYHVLKQNPVRVYGESVVILLQTITMVALMWRFGVNVDDDGGAQKKKPAGGGLARWTAIVLGSVSATALTMRYLPPAMWGLLVVTSTPAILAVQLPQMYKNFCQKHTGELAPMTVLLALLGSSIRIWTTLADLGGDPWLLFNYLIGVVTNGTLLAQIWVYRSRTAEVRRVVEGRAHGAAPAA